MLIRQTLAYLPSQVIGPLLQFVTVIVLTHFLAPADYGVTMLIFTSQELIYMASLAWWSSYMLRYGGLFASGEDNARFRATQAGVLLVTALLQVGLALLLVRLFLEGSSPAFSLVTAGFVVTRSFLGFLSERARAEVRILDFSILQIAPPLLGLLLSIAALSLEGPRTGIVLAVFAAVQGLVALVMGVRLGTFAVPRRPDREILRASTTFGASILAGGVLLWCCTNGIRLVVESMGGAEALGLLSVSWGVAQRLAAMAGTLVTAAAYPLAIKAMMAGDEDGAREQISRNSALLMLVMAPAVAGVIAINEPMMTLLVAKEFQAMSIAILPAAILGAGLRNMRMHGWDQLYLLFEKQHLMLVLAFIEAVLVILGTILGFHLAGVQGAVTACAVVVALLVVADYGLLRTRFGLEAPFGQYLRIVLAALVMLLVLRAGGAFGLAIAPGWLSLVRAILEGGFLYLAALALLFPRERAVVFAQVARFVRARRAPPPEAP